MTIPENATYTAAEVKVLTETATRLGRELGRREAQTECAAMLDDRAAGWTLRDSETGAVLRGMASTIRSIASQPSGDESGATCPDCGLTGDHKGGCPQTGEAPTPGAPG